jgi:ABC-type transport system involved in multi-copper enzyme maturation permease subunit
VSKNLQRIVYAILLVLVVSLLLPQIAYAQDDDTGSALGAGLYLLCCGAMFIVNIAILVWVVKDAQNRGASAGAWLLIVLIFGILGLLAYLVARPQGKLVACPNCGKNKPIRDQICPHCGARVA